MERLNEIRKELRKTRQEIMDNCNSNLEAIDLALEEQLKCKMDKLLAEVNSINKSLAKKSLSNMYLHAYA